MSFQIKKIDNITYGEFTEFAENKTTACVSFRHGGVSIPPFDFLNLGLHTNDNNSDVLKNRKLFFKALNIDHREIVTLKQIHGKKVVITGDKDRGRGAQEYEDSLTEADGMVTAMPGIPMVVFTADCMPVFLFDPENKVIGIAHAGWKGTLHRIAENTVKAMKGLGADPACMIAGLGPAIGGCCYEIGPDMADKFNNKFIQIKNGTYFNLTEANEDILISSGLRKENIIHSNVCTLCRSDLCFSYRRGHPTGRMASVIMMQ